MPPVDQIAPFMSLSFSWFEFEEFHFWPKIVCWLLLAFQSFIRAPFYPCRWTLSNFYCPIFYWTPLSVLRSVLCIGKFGHLSSWVSFSTYQPIPYSHCSLEWVVKFCLSFRLSRCQITGPLVPLFWIFFGWTKVHHWALIYPFNC